MERRNLLAGLAVLALSLFVLSGTAFAHAAHHKKVKPREHGSSSAETCVVHAMPNAFMDQGEFGTSSSVADIIEVECEEVYAEQHVRISANELYSRCDKSLYWRTPYERHTEYTEGASFSVELDNDGNATAIVIGGPSCAAGESLISAHLESAPYTTVTTVFTVLPPRPTEPGVFATPESKVEGENYSDVATIVQVEFSPVFAEEPVNVDFAQLESRCKVCPYTEAIVMGENGYPYTESKVSDVTLNLDNDGNAFVVLVGNASCAAGSSLIEASLENAPYTTYTTDFTVEPPQPTFPN
ncbi:MAG TPA: hypothetical protein VMI13_07575 [Solirubrobacteraceae bacterium]|nr:hypothetical protein [Solirubrobacteraceae bacterium]